MLLKSQLNNRYVPSFICLSIDPGSSIAKLYPVPSVSSYCILAFQVDLGGIDFRRSSNGQRVAIPEVNQVQYYLIITWFYTFRALETWVPFFYNFLQCGLTGWNVEKGQISHVYINDLEGFTVTSAEALFYIFVGLAAGCCLPGTYVEEIRKCSQARCIHSSMSVVYDMWSLMRCKLFSHLTRFVVWAQCPRAFINQSNFYGANIRSSQAQWREIQLYERMYYAFGILRCFLKISVEGAKRIDSGRWFKSKGAQEWKALMLALVLTLQTVSVSFIWSQWPGWEWCGQNGMKINRLLLT